MQTISDGWILNEVWNAAQEANRTPYDEWIETDKESENKGDDMTVERANRLWPFDMRRCPSYNLLHPFVFLSLLTTE